MLKNQQKIIFSGDGTSHQNGSLDRTTKTVVTTKMATLMHDALRCTNDTLSTDICPMEMYYFIWIYNHISNIKSGISAIEILPISSFYPFTETLSNFHVWFLQHMFWNQSCRILE